MRKKSDRVMTVVMALEEKVVRTIYIYMCMVRKVAEQVQRKSVFMTSGVSGIFSGEEERCRTSGENGREIDFVLVGREIESI